MSEGFGLDDEEKRGSSRGGKKQRQQIGIGIEEWMKETRGCRDWGKKGR